MTKNEKRVIIVDVIIFAIFLTVSLAVPFTKNAVFWIALVFGCMAIAIQLYVIKSAFGKEDTVRSRFYGFPIAKIGILYMLVQVALSLAFMIIAKFVPIPNWIVIVTCCILLGIAAIGFIAADATRDEIERMDTKLAIDTECMQNLRSIVYPLSQQCEDADAKKALEKLSDDFKYSDPVSNVQLQNVEAELVSLVSMLQETVLNGDNSGIIELCKRITVSLTERNRLCKLSKGK